MEGKILSITLKYCWYKRSGLCDHDGLLMSWRQMSARQITSYWFNLSPPSAAYMRWGTGSALVQVMACRLTTQSHYLTQCWLIVNWTLGNKLQWNCNQDSNISSLKKMHLKISSAIFPPHCPRGDELTVTTVIWTYFLTCESHYNLFLRGRKVFNPSDSLSSAGSVSDSDNAPWNEDSETY